MNKTKKRVPQYIYIDKNENIIKDKVEIDRLNAIGVPPGYHDVILTSNENSPILAISKDDKDRQQYVYNPRITKKNKLQKYENVITLGRYITKIRDDIHKILVAINRQSFKTWEQPRAMIAVVIYLMDKCSFRVGNMKYVLENGSYGCTTLCRKHVKLDHKTSTIHFKFIGKKGVVNEASVKDNLMWSIMKKIIANRKGFLFVSAVSDDSADSSVNSSNSTPVGSDEVQDFLQTYDPLITPKMFRTWNANYHFIEKLRNDLNNTEMLETYLKNKKSKSKYVNLCCDHVSSQLHNTASVSKENYVSSGLIDKFVNSSRLIKQLESPKYKDQSTDKILLHILG
jgi:DNA topoisomerase-1